MWFRFAGFSVKRQKNFYYTRANSYATESYIKGYFDLPAILEAEIPCENLLPAKNYYEAGLRPEYKSQLKNLKIKEVELNPNNFFARWPGVRWFNLAFIGNRYGSKYPEQQKHLTDVILRLTKDEMLEIQEEEYVGHRISDNPRFEIKM